MTCEQFPQTPVTKLAEQSGVPHRCQEIPNDFLDEMYIIFQVF